MNNEPYANRNLNINEILLRRALEAAQRRQNDLEQQQEQERQRQEAQQRQDDFNRNASLTQRSALAVFEEANRNGTAVKDLPIPPKMQALVRSFDDGKQKSRDAQPSTSANTYHPAPQDFAGAPSGHRNDAQNIMDDNVSAGGSWNQSR
ncbi:hypothetical protein FJU08_13745 [Martelella alba]|uniref:Uncharacterized protein n=1 Tax=Martelella alba TaxID=2590451 RepID=A0A506U6C3_9HYPH|nr:hypothetical protein [Martelella alba]TPW29400.1 hypothetical protein FJU08_13745 [Martelella alba]